MSDRHWHVSNSDVLSATGQILDTDRSGVLATIVGVEGNAYRRPGAKMLIDADDGSLGHITAGCLEEEVIAIAESVLEANSPRIETYDLMDDEDDVWGLGLGCNGIIDVLLEPIGSQHQPLIDAVRTQSPIGSITVIDGDAPTGAKAYYSAGAFVGDTQIPKWVLDAVSDSMETVVTDGTADAVTVASSDETVTVFLDGFRPPTRIVICGSGHDIGPVVELAKQNDFHVTVASFRGAVDIEDRFPHADSHILTRPDELTDAVDLDSETYVLIMSHNFIDDQLALESLVGTPVPYIGLMGPRSRFEELIEAIQSSTSSQASLDLSSVYTPVGLDLGSGSPYGIATSIIAEILAVANDRKPQHLTERKGPIHDRVNIDINSN